MNPYLVLGVPRNADDRLIRKAYLEAVKAATPDTHPERFKQISTAYESIKDEKSRNHHALFDRSIPGETPFDAYVRYARIGVKPKPMPFEAMKEYLRSCSKT
jgi:curved DNA-binding protein CbpA